MTERCNNCDRLKTESNTTYLYTYCWWCEDRTATNLKTTAYHG